VISVLAQVLSSRIESNCEKNEAACFVFEKSDNAAVRAFKYYHEELLQSENPGIDLRSKNTDIKPLIIVEGKEDLYFLQSYLRYLSPDFPSVEWLEINGKGEIVGV